MTTFSIHLNERELVSLIKFLMCLSDETVGTFTYFTKGKALRVHFRGDNKKVQKQICEWLSIPERKQNFMGAKDDKSR